MKDVDDRGRPKKLMKIGSLAQAQADRAMRIFAFKAAAKPHVEGEGEETVMIFANGERIVRLLTPAALDRESAVMGHCVGQGNYDAGVRDGSVLIYSLRDRGNKAHVRLDVRAAKNELLQCRGRENRAPVKRYMPAVRAFIEREGFVLRESARITGLVQYVNGGDHSIMALPEGLDGGGDLNLCGMAIKVLPEGLHVGGSLDLRDTAIDVLPLGIMCKTVVLPNGRVIGGSRRRSEPVFAMDPGNRVFRKMVMRMGFG